MNARDCAFTAAHHSDDHVTVHAGRPYPVTLCGYHASPEWLPHVLASLAGAPTFAVYRGQLAYVDAFRAGLVPVKVLTVSDAGKVSARVTAARPGYARGEILEDLTPGRQVIPRTAVFVRGGQYRISGVPVRAIPDAQMSGKS